jgi:hypothetical protein
MSYPDWDAKAIARHLETWAKKSTSLKMEQFFHEFMIRPGTFKRFVKECPSVFDAYFRVKLVLMRRNRELHRSKVVKRYPQGDSDDRESNVIPLR